MDYPLKLKILSTEGCLLEEGAEYVGLMAVSGSLGILKGHLPLAAALKKSVVTYRKDGKDFSFEIPGGIAEVKDDMVTIITQQ